VLVIVVLVITVYAVVGIVIIIVIGGKFSSTSFMVSVVVCGHCGGAWRVGAIAVEWVGPLSVVVAVVLVFSGIIIIGCVVISIGSVVRIIVQKVVFVFYQTHKDACFQRIEVDALWW